MSITTIENQPKKFVRVGLALVLRAEPRSDFLDPIIMQTSELLITLRRPASPYGGWWEFPGGKIDADESVAAGVTREVREEIGCTIQVLDELAAHRHEYAHACVELTPIVCRIREGEPRNLEVAAHRWVKLGRLPVPGFLPGNLELISALRARAGLQPLAS